MELRGTALALDQEVFRSHRGQPVLYRRFEIHEKVLRNDKTEWRKIREESFGTRLYLQDTTGIAEVIIADMDMILPEEEFPYSVIPESNSDLLNAAGTALSVLSALNVIGGEQRMTEWIIPENSELFLQGNFKTQTKTVAGKTINALVSKHSERPSFLSTDAEGKLVSKQKWTFIGELLAGAVMIYIGCAHLS